MNSDVNVSSKIQIEPSRQEPGKHDVLSVRWLATGRMAIRRRLASFSTLNEAVAAYPDASQCSLFNRATQEAEGVR